MQGGMGAVSRAIASSAQAAGAELFPGSEVSTVLCDTLLDWSVQVAAITTAPGGRASGLVLQSGQEVLCVVWVLVTVNCAPGAGRPRPQQRHARGHIQQVAAALLLTVCSDRYRLMAASVDVPASYRRALARIDYTSPVCKINIAVNRSANCTNCVCTALLRIPNFLADPNSSPNRVMPHHRATIHLNCETSHLIEEAYRHAVAGRSNYAD